jgi:hypothetical protein
MIIILTVSRDRASRYGTGAHRPLFKSERLSPLALEANLSEHTLLVIWSRQYPNLSKVAFPQIQKQLHTNCRYQLLVIQWHINFVCGYILHANGIYRLLALHRLPFQSHHVSFQKLRRPQKCLSNYPPLWPRLQQQC